MENLTLESVKKTSKLTNCLKINSLIDISLSAAGKGVLRSMLINPDGLIEAIPVDACINGILTLTKHVATEERYADPPLKLL